MAKAVTPKVFLIAKSSIRPEEARKWMEHMGVSSEDFDCVGGPTDAADIVTLAAKRCYMSYTNKLNPNVKKVRTDYTEYIDNILKSGHGSCVEHVTFTFAIENVSRVFCYHPETEVLTRRGWKSVAAVEDGEEVLTLNPETKRARWSINHKLHTFEYSGPLHYWENNEDESPRVTPDHTLWCCPVDLRKVRGLKAAEALAQFGRKATFAEMLGKRFFVQNAIGEIDGADDATEVVIGAHTYDAALLFEWLGWVATDGTIAKEETGRSRVRINQSKPEGVTRIRELCERLFGDRVRETGDNYKAFDVSDPELRSWCMRTIGRTKRTRDLSPLYGLSRRLIRAFLLGAAGGDGTIGSNDHRTICCGGYPALAGHYQVLVAICGLASRVSERVDAVGKQREVGGSLIVNKLPNITLEIHRRGNGACTVRASNQRVIHHVGLVHCPQTNDGIVYVRAKGGKAVWCGNTAEMNRHRAGMAISEGSLRFIRFGEEIRYVLPPSLNCGMDSQDPPDVKDKKAMTRDILQKAFEQQEELYRELEKIWDMDESDKSFSYKKQMTSLFRRIVGMGVATGGVWTGNIRALRNILEQRCSPHAEEEIFYVFSTIFKMIVEAEPLFFGDFSWREDGALKPKYHKV